MWPTHPGVRAAIIMDQKRAENQFLPAKSVWYRSISMALGSIVVITDH